MIMRHPASASKPCICVRKFTKNRAVTSWPAVNWKPQLKRAARGVRKPQRNWKATMDIDTTLNHFSEYSSSWNIILWIIGLCSLLGFTLFTERYMHLRKSETDTN